MSVTKSNIDQAPKVVKTKTEVEVKERTESKDSKSRNEFDYLSWFAIIIMTFVAIYWYPNDMFTIQSKVDLQHVFYFAWITAVATGVGVVPFFFFSKFDEFYIGISNAIAGGMMVAASYSLTFEGVTVTEISDSVSMSPMWRTALGFALGIVFIKLTKTFLDAHEDVKLEGFDTSSAKKMILIIFVMTLHSLTEGIGIGVSFGGHRGAQLGQFISLSLAVHNIPEGLAVALVLTSRNVSKIRSVVWAVFTSLPQPLMAIPAYMFVEKFVPVLPFGLGFASGAMAYVAVFELLTEAMNETSLSITAVIGTISCLMMVYAQETLKTVV